MKCYDIRQNQYESIQRQYDQIEASCEKLGVPIQLYLELINDIDGSLENHNEKLSELERCIQNDDWD